MYTKHLNVAWLIMVTLLTGTINAQILVSSENPVELTISCDESQNSSRPMATSSCEGDLKYEYNAVLFSGGCYGTIERTWSISDPCGNNAEFKQFIKRKDKTAPELDHYPEDVTVSLSNIPEIENVKVIDHCDEKPGLKFSEIEKKDSEGNLILITRKWEFFDACGNKNTHEQKITIAAEGS